MRSLLATLLLSGCYDPISNASFYEDQRFNAALPTAARLAPPEAIGLATVGDSVVLAAAAQSHADYIDLVHELVETGEQLRSTSPDERGPDFRQWDPMPVATLAGGSVETWWVRADIAAAGSGPLVTNIDIASDQDGPWVSVGSGFHDDEGGRIDWDLEALGTPGTLSVEYEIGLDWGRNVVVEYRDITVASSRQWGLYGPAVMGLPLSDLVLTDDEAAWPAAVALTVQATGGRAEGQLWSESGQLPFTACWDADGNQTYIGGDEPVITVGEKSACLDQPLLDAVAEE